MNTELFIARRLFFDKKSRKNISGQIINIALVSIAVSLAVMIISVAIVTGFKNEVSNKTVGFGGHIQIVNFDSNNSPETQPISRNQPFLANLKQMGFIKTIQVFATKPGIIKTEDNIEGVILKGVDTDYDWSFFNDYILSGNIPAITDSARTNEVLISKKTSDLLGLNTGDDMYVYFIGNDGQSTNTRQFKVCGVFSTGLEEFDRLYMLGDIKHIQRLNDWQPNQVSGFEIIIKNFAQIEKAEYQIREQVISYHDENEETLRTESIVRKYPQIYDWLSIIDMNVWVILIIMALVAGINMISGLLVLILEKSQMIGILKSMGSQGYSIRKIFIYLSAFLITRGLLWGNVTGVLFIVVQKFFRVIPLDPVSYYVSYVPVNFSFFYLILLNIGTLAVVLSMLVLPTFYIGRISPEKTIRFE
jgi:lipoprotein-releasing system permease protein